MGVSSAEFTRTGLDPGELDGHNPGMRATAQRRVRSSLLALGVCLGLSSFGVGPFALGVAHAQAIDDAGGVDYPAPEPTERGGFMIGVSASYGYGDVVGYPNKLTEIGDPAFRQHVSGFGSATSLWLGGALRDWVTFGVGLTTGAVLKGDLTGAGAGLGVRLEGYPLFALGGAWHNIGVSGEFGIGGGAVINAKDKKNALADGGSMSSLSFGTFWEVLKFWHSASGPMVQYKYSFSDSMSAHVVSVGLRTALYWTRPSAPPAPKAPAAAYQPYAPGAEALTTRW